MSVRAISWAFEQELDPSRKIVLLALADFADDDGECWPSLDRIAVKCSMSKSTVQRSIADLEAAGLLSHEAVREPGSHRQKSNRYALKMGSGGQIDTRTPVVTGDYGSGGQIDQIPVVTSDHVTVRDPSDLDPSIRVSAKKQGTKKPKQLALPEIDTLPPWLNKPAWQEFREHRSEIRSPMTERGERKALEQLRKVAGDSPSAQKAVIDQSIAARWQGLFPLRSQHAVSPPPPAEKPRRVQYID